MILLKSETVKNIHTVEGLRQAVQQAIELEHATIPTYLYALYSLKAGSNQEIRRLILSVVVEEMLHMSLACNILNAIGGTPVIDDPSFIPKYPGPLPGSVESGLIVPLAPFSIELVKDVFMVIEEPEQPLDFPVLMSEADGKITIGQFYQAIADQIKALGDGIFTGDESKQVVSSYWPDELIKITDVQSALHAIDIIVEQGEGTSTSPLDLEGDFAHYYRYAEIFHGKKLILNPDAKPGTPHDQKYIYGGDPIPFDPAGVLPLIENPSAASYAPNSKAQYANDTFNYTYTSLLRSLHATFNGQPDRLKTAIGLMESLKLQALDLMDIDLGNGKHAGPSFEYQPFNP
ncbi:ferritin-like protein [Paenibacillus sp. YYML68]|uniref:ferritin-like domain-containing protein n=1 Tax=Paenibacillus sp. YYML68 TaxID=2909250 RepID=UPI002492103F|nr:ferritin-like protein [Paenibacillus sp. YYML68]